MKVIGGEERLKQICIDDHSCWECGGSGYGDITWSSDTGEPIMDRCLVCGGSGDAEEYQRRLREY